MGKLLLFMFVDFIHQPEIVCSVGIQIANDKSRINGLVAGRNQFVSSGIDFLDFPFADFAEDFDAENGIFRIVIAAADGIDMQPVNEIVVGVIALGADEFCLRAVQRIGFCFGTGLTGSRKNFPGKKEHGAENSQ